MPRTLVVWRPFSCCKLCATCAPKPATHTPRTMPGMLGALIFAVVGQCLAGFSPWALREGVVRVVRRRRFGRPNHAEDHVSQLPAILAAPTTATHHYRCSQNRQRPRSRLGRSAGLPAAARGYDSRPGRRRCVRGRGGGCSIARYPGRTRMFCYHSAQPVLVATFCSSAALLRARCGVTLVDVQALQRY